MDVFHAYVGCCMVAVCLTSTYKLTATTELTNSSPFNGEKSV